MPGAAKVYRSNCKSPELRVFQAVLVRALHGVAMHCVKSRSVQYVSCTEASRLSWQTAETPGNLVLFVLYIAAAVCADWFTASKPDPSVIR